MNESICNIDGMEQNRSVQSNERLLAKHLKCGKILVFLNVGGSNLGNILFSGATSA